MLDLTKPAMPTGGKRYYYLARAAISLEPLYDQPTLTAVQTIVNMLDKFPPSSLTIARDTYECVSVNVRSQRKFGDGLCTCILLYAEVVILTDSIVTKILSGLNLKLALMVNCFPCGCSSLKDWFWFLSARTTQVHSISIWKLTQKIFIRPRVS